MARKIFVAALLLGLTGCATIGQQYGSGIFLAYTFQHGITDYQAERYSAAAGEFTTVIARNPNYVPAYEWRGMTYVAMRDYRDSIADYSRALQLLDRSNATRAQRAMTLERRAVAKDLEGKFAGAIADDAQAIALSPDDTEPYLDRAAIYSGHHEYNKAIADEALVLRKDPYLVSALGERAYTYAAMHDYARAIADETAIIGRSRTTGSALNSRCWYQALMGTQLQRALDDCNAALRLPISKDLRYATLQSRSFVYFKKGLFARSIVDSNAALSITKRADGFYVRALAERALGNATDADRDFAAAHQVDPAIEAQYAGYGIK